MNDIRYEPVFGDQSLFAKGPEDADIVGKYMGYLRFYKVCNSGMYLYRQDIWHKADNDYPGVPLLAMRRIIPAPKRWTQADKDAGRLPDVGCKCRQGSKDEIVVAVTGKFVVTECQDMSVCTTRNDVFIRSYKPIESPEEKAQRERDEWCKKASFIIPSVTGGLISDLGCIHDALLSGELKMPEVQK